MNLKSLPSPGDIGIDPNPADPHLRSLYAAVLWSAIYDLQRFKDIESTPTIDRPSVRRNADLVIQWIHNEKPTTITFEQCLDILCLNKEALLKCIRARGLI